MHYLSRTFRQTALIPKEVRPHYFGSLANFHLNHWLEGRHGHDLIAISVQQFAPLFTLPALKTLKVGVGGHGQEREPAYEWEFDPRSSVVQHLDLSMMLLKKSEVATFLGATKSLKSFTSGFYWIDDIHEVEEGLLHNAAQTLETLDLSWYEYNRRLPQLRGFKALKDVRLRPLETRSQRTRARTKAPYRLVDLSQFMPASLEKLRITGQSRDGLQPGDVDALLDDLLGLVNKRGKAFPNLKGVYVRKVLRAKSTQETAALGNIKWSSLREACKTRGIVLSD